MSEYIYILTGICADHALLGKTKTENAELQQKVKELEAKLAALEPQEEVEAEEGREEAT